MTTSYLQTFVGASCADQQEESKFKAYRTLRPVTGERGPEEGKTNKYLLVKIQGSL